MPAQFAESCCDELIISKLLARCILEYFHVEHLKPKSHNYWGKLSFTAKLHWWYLLYGEYNIYNIILYNSVWMKKFCGRFSCSSDFCKREFFLIISSEFLVAVAWSVQKYITYIIYNIIYDIGVNVWVKECSWEGFLQERVLQVRVYRELVSTPAPLEPENRLL